MTAADVRDLLPLYALGLLEASEAVIVERALATDPALVAELATYQDAALAVVAPVAPPPMVKARLLASVGGGPFEKFTSRMTTLFDVTVERAREILGLMERPASWIAEMPGIEIVHFDGGPACAAADCGLIRLAPGSTFPQHSHLGEEVSVILSGQLQDDTGKLFNPGDDMVQAEGSEHHLTVVGDEPCIFAARAMNGIAIAGAPARPSRH
jgi:hypothetical protein